MAWRCNGTSGLTGPGSGFQTSPGWRTRSAAAGPRPSPAPARLRSGSALSWQLTFLHTPTRSFLSYWTVSRRPQRGSHGSMGPVRSRAAERLLDSQTRRQTDGPCEHRYTAHRADTNISPSSAAWFSVPLNEGRCNKNGQKNFTFVNVSDQHWRRSVTSSCWGSHFLLADDAKSCAGWSSILGFKRNYFYIYVFYHTLVPELHPAEICCTGLYM